MSSKPYLEVTRQDFTFFFLSVSTTTTIPSRWVWNFNERILSEEKQLKIKY